MPCPVKEMAFFLPELCTRKSPCEYKTRTRRDGEVTGQKKTIFPSREGEVVRLAEGSGAIKQEPTAEREGGHEGDERAAHSPARHFGWRTF